MWVSSEGLGVSADPAHRTSLFGGEEPGVHVGAVVELGHHDPGILVPRAREHAEDGDGEGGPVGGEGDLAWFGSEEVAAAWQASRRISSVSTVVGEAPCGLAPLRLM